MDQINSIQLEQINSTQLHQIIKSRNFERLQSILLKYIENLMILQDFTNCKLNTIHLTYNNKIHRSKIISYRNDVELVYKIVSNMFGDIKFLLFYDWDMDLDIITNLINILIKNDSLTMSIKSIDII